MQHINWLIYILCNRLRKIQINKKSTKEARYQLELLNDDLMIKNHDFDCELIIWYIWFIGDKHEELFFYFFSLFYSFIHCHFVNAWKEVCVCLGYVMVFFLILILKLYAYGKKKKVLRCYMCIIMALTQLSWHIPLQRRFQLHQQLFMSMLSVMFHLVWFLILSSHLFCTYSQNNKLH